MEKKYILSAELADMKLRRMAYEILENNPGVSAITLAAIHGNGLVVARQMERLLRSISSVSVEQVEVTMDKHFPGTAALSRPIDLEGRTIILIDDVTNSGRVLVYALKPFLEGYPGRIQSLVLIERSHKTFPIHPDYVGLSLSTTLHEHISVEVNEDRVTGAWLSENIQ
jgi:pyrimidine operon attenuation protein / uracil phosphoribosyltransferase